MNARTETGASALDTVKLFLAIAVLIGGIVAYYYYPDLSVLIRAGGILASVVIAIVIVMQTAKGRDMWQFIQTSRVELRKVVWPNRQETTQTTLAVIVFVIILGVFFWGLDMGLLWVTKTLTGQGG
ncbi:MAG: preprotein translocase subunit SecE [Gammaproteobacteria bacterium]|nr:preprotein translocase subunit SecE [Gammaproteobacteria bacterium]